MPIGAPGGLPRDDTRTRLIAAAAAVYAQFGHHGTTTRAIAAEAGVNEVTLFRLFGSKDALLDEAIATTAESGAAATSLPEAPRDPQRELAAWCRAELARLREGRAFIRKCFADSEEHPDHVRRVAAGSEAAARALREYAGRLARAGIARASVRDRDTAVTMLMATLIADALGRDEMAGVFQVPANEAPRRYVGHFLAAIGVEAGGGD